VMTASAVEIPTRGRDVRARSPRRLYSISQASRNAYPANARTTAIAADAQNVSRSWLQTRERLGWGTGSVCPPRPLTSGLAPTRTTAMANTPRGRTLTTTRAIRSNQM
jgi:hypothetical protein